MSGVVIREWLSTWGVIVNLVGVAIGAGVVIERQSSGTAAVKQSHEELRNDITEKMTQLSEQVKELRQTSGQGRESLVKLQSELTALATRVDRLDRFNETQTIVNQTTMRDIARIESRKD